MKEVRTKNASFIYVVGHNNKHCKRVIINSSETKLFQIYRTLIIDKNGHQTGALSSVDAILQWWY